MELLLVVPCVCVIPQYLFCTYIQKEQKVGAPAAAVLMSRKELFNPFDSDEEEDDPYRDLIRAADQPAADQPAADQPADQSCADITTSTTEQPSTLLPQLSSSQPSNGDTNKTESGQYQHMDW